MLSIKKRIKEQVFMLFYSYLDWLGNEKTITKKNRFLKTKTGKNVECFVIKVEEQILAV